MNKGWDAAGRAVADIRGDVVVMIGGFGGGGFPGELVTALRDHGARGLTIIANNLGGSHLSVGLLLQNHQVRRALCSFPIGRRQKGAEEVFWEQFGLRPGDVEVELVPQGTLSERIRAGGAGIPAFYTPTGVGTDVAEGEEIREFRGRQYVLEHALTADFALIKAWKGDRWGNLVYRKTARNFNPMMATAARVTIAEVEELVELGELDPDCIVTPGIYVSRILKGASYEKRIERRTVREKA